MKIRAKVKIGDLIEALGCNDSGQEKIAPKTLKINTPDGYKKIQALRKTQLNPEWKINTLDFEAIVADKHKVETKNGTFSDNRYWKNTDELSIGEEIFTENGWQQIKEIQYLNKESYMYDFQVEDCHSYYANGIHGHNSIFLPNFGIKALLNGLNVVHYSLEMSEDRIGMRYDAIASSISVSKLIGSPEEIKEKYETYRKITKSRLKLKEFPTSMASIMDIEAHLDNLKLLDDFDPDLIIIDYGDIMKSTRSTKNTYEEQGWIFRELRGLAIKRNIAIITATQTRRDALTADGGTSDMVGMDQAADSMEKNRILDVLFSITQSRADRDQGRINLWIAKNRNGASNQQLEFTINYKNFQIKEINLLGKNQSSINPNDISKKLENELSMELENEENT